MSGDLKNKVAVITGGARGLGYAIAEAFLREGANSVVLLDVDAVTGAAAAEALNSGYQGRRVEYIQCDITAHLDTVAEAIFRRYSIIDILVNNAGVLCEDNPKKCIEVNVLATIEWTKRFWEHMRTDKGGKGGTIMNMSSAATYITDPYISVYRASKYAVLGFTRAFGHEYNYRRSGVRVVALCPGMTETELARNIVTSDEEQVQRDFKEYLKKYSWLQPIAVGEAAVDVFRRADSGTAWMIKSDQVVEELR